MTYYVAVTPACLNCSQVDRSKMVSEVAEKSEAVQAATQRAKELTDAGRDHGVGKAWNWAWLRMKRAGGGFYSVFWREHNFEQHILAEEKRLKVNLVARTGKLEVLLDSESPSVSKHQVPKESPSV